MARQGSLTKVLAVMGMLFVCLPIVATVMTSVVGSIRARVFRLDWLMPAELFPAALAGGVLLLGAAVIVRARVRPIGWGLGTATGMLFLCQALAVATGLASGRAEPTGWRLALVLGALVLYIVALVELCVAAALLVRDLLWHGE